jgi:phosphonopyruvate decarboxylase
MVDPQKLFDSLAANGVSLYTGVPDSVLKDFCAFVTDHQPRHVIAANEGGAVALAAGHYLATGELALVYMQNSGFGNAVNPLMSLTDPLVYGIPMLLLIGWRGEPGKTDEPQHLKQGERTLAFLETAGLPYDIIDASTVDIEATAKRAVAVARVRSCPYALVVREHTFAPYRLLGDQETDYPLRREEALNVVLDAVGETAIVVSTAGMASRELFEYRASQGGRHNRDFLAVGSMGHASQIALGIALAKPDRLVCCLDGDGAAIMHLGAMAIIGSLSPANFRHIIMNNGAHDSVGGQPTAGFQIAFSGIAAACGYAACVVAASPAEISEALEAFASVRGPALLEIRVRRGQRSNLGRPTSSPAASKARFMESLRT